MSKIPYRAASPPYRIDLFEVSPHFQNEQLLKVTPESGIGLRRIVERFAHNLQHEIGTDFRQFDALDEKYTDDQKPFTAYLFTNIGMPYYWVGACCFLKDYCDEVGREIEILNWIWLHPYFRAKDILAQQWPTLRKNHGDFLVQMPHSKAMEAFLKKHNQDSIFCPLYEGKELDIEKVKAQLLAAKAPKPTAQSKKGTQNRMP